MFAKYDNTNFPIIYIYLNGTNIMGLDTSLNEEYKILSDENILRIINENVTQLKYSQIENPLNDSCAICQDDFNPDDDVCKINSCGHIFKNNLINNWLKEKHSCPVCI